MWYLLDENKKPYPVEIEQVTSENMAPFKIVQQDTLDNGLFVSTVFLGLDHGFGNRNREGYKPVLWETMIFNDNDTTQDYQERYTSYEDAVAGHQRALDYANKSN